MATFASNIEWHFQDTTPNFVDRVAAAKQAGFDQVEFHMWRDKDIKALRLALDEHGVTVSSHLVDPRVNITDPETHHEFVQAIRDAIETAQFLGAQSLVTFTGMDREGVSHDEQFQNVVNAFKRIVPIVEESGIEILVEPVNTNVDHPGAFFNSTGLGLDLVEALSSHAFGLLYDKYHSDAQGENMMDVLSGRAHLVRYIQVADSHGRAEPGSGSIDWDQFVADVKAIDFTGTIGLEYHPSGGTLESIETTRSKLKGLNS